MSLTVDDETAKIVGNLADRLGTTSQEAVRHAVQSTLDILDGGSPLKEKLKAFYARHPRPVPTGLPADKAFYDDLSGELD